MPSSRPLVPVALAVLLAASAVRADPVSFSYSLTLGGPGSSSTSVSLYDYNGATGVLTLAAGGTASAVPGGAGYGNALGTPITVATVSADLLPASVPYVDAWTTVKLRLTDAASGESGTTSLTAYLTGWNDTDSGTGTMTGNTVGIGDPLKLGGHTYTFETFMDGGYPPAGLGTMIALVFVDRPAWDPRDRPPTLPGPAVLATGPIVRAPEPSSLALAGAAASMLGGWALRRRCGRRVAA
jgi:hypothetical protein